VLRLLGYSYFRYLRTVALAYTRVLHLEKRLYAPDVIQILQCHWRHCRCVGKLQIC